MADPKPKRPVLTIADLIARERSDATRTRSLAPAPARTIGPSQRADRTGMLPLPRSPYTEADQYTGGQPSAADLAANIPGLGDVISSVLAGRAAVQGKPGEAAAYALGALPLVTHKLAKPAVKVLEEAADGVGRARKEFLYAMPNGQQMRVTAFEPITPPREAGKSVVVDIRNADGGRTYDWKGTIGVPGVRTILRDVAEAFPNAERALGPRVSGARAGPMATRNAKGTAGVFDLTRVRKAADALPPAPAPTPKLAKVGGDRTKVTPVVQGARSTPKEVAARVAAAHGILDEPVVPFTPVARGFLDRGLIVPDAPVPSAGSPFPVRAVPKTNRQAMGHFRGMDAPANIDLIARQMQRGQDLGGRTFYPSYAAVEETLAGRGMDPRVLLDATSAGSIRSPVTNELANASVIHWGLQRGLFDANALRGMSSKELEATAKRLREAIADAFPGAPGIPLMGTHLGTYGNLATDTAPDAYKVLTYRGQKGSVLNPNRGNVPGIVLDTHEATGTTLGSPFHTYFSEQGGFTGPEYGLQEDLVRQVARSLNLSDRTAQAGRWSGGGKLTGLISPPADYAQIFEDLVQWNAKQRGIGGATLLGGVAKGDDILYPFYGRKGFGPL